MKTIIILGALVISTGSFAQGRTEAIKVEKQIGKSQIELKEHADNGQKEVKEKLGQVKDQVSKTSRKGTGNGDGNGDGAGNGGANGKGAKNEAMNHAEASMQDKKEMLEKKIGQSRAAEAKLKAKQVKTKADADALIRMSKEDTKETMNSIDTKMISVRMKLSDKLASGEITQTQFNEKISKLMDFEKRKNAIVNEME